MDFFLKETTNNFRQMPFKRLHGTECAVSLAYCIVFDSDFLISLANKKNSLLLFLFFEMEEKRKQVLCDNKRVTGDLISHFWLRPVINPRRRLLFLSKQKRTGSSLKRREEMDISKNGQTQKHKKVEKSKKSGVNTILFPLGRSIFSSYSDYYDY